MTEKSMSQVFEDAAGALQDKGWHQGSLGSPDYAMCALGALNYAYSGDCHFWAPYAIIRPLDSKLEGLGWFTGVATWNDQKGQTREEVIDTLMECAKDLRNEGR